MLSLQKQVPSATDGLRVTIPCPLARCCMPRQGKIPPPVVPQTNQLQTGGLGPSRPSGRFLGFVSLITSQAVSGRSPLAVIPSLDSPDVLLISPTANGQHLSAKHKLPVEWGEIVHPNHPITSPVTLRLSDSRGSMFVHS